MQQNFLRASGQPPRVYQDRYRHIDGLMDGVRVDNSRGGRSYDTESDMNRADRVLFRRQTGASSHMRTGRQRIEMNGHLIFDGVYTCATNLAGELYLATHTGKLFEIPFRPSGDECGHSDCAMSSRIKPGGLYDGVAILLPQEYTAKMDVGDWPTEFIPEPEVWQEHYHYAVRASRKTSIWLSDPKRVAFYGKGFTPQSYFGDAVLHLIRMFGLHGVSVYHMIEKSEIFSAALIGRFGSSARLSQYFDNTARRFQLDVSNYAHAFHIMTQLKGRFPHVPLPLKVFCEGVDRISRNPYRAFHRIIFDQYVKPVQGEHPELDLKSVHDGDPITERSAAREDLQKIVAAERKRYDILRAGGMSESDVLRDNALVKLYLSRQAIREVNETLSGTSDDVAMVNVPYMSGICGHMELDHSDVIKVSETVVSDVIPFEMAPLPDHLDDLEDANPEWFSM